MPDIKSPIPIKNIFFLLCYAWNILPAMQDVRVGKEDIKDAYNLLAKIFTEVVGKLIRSGFHRSYIETVEETPSIKGKIDLKSSINALSFLKARLVCVFDNYSPNDIFNQILKYTLELIIHEPAFAPEIKNAAKKHLVFFSEIEQASAPTKDNLRKLKFNRNNITYKLLIHIASMLYENSFINEETGTRLFKDFFREGLMDRVFEKFILNFYAIHLNRSTHTVHAPHIAWPLEDKADEIWGGIFTVNKNLGDRRTDVVVENKVKKLQLIIDAKYYKQTFVSAYMNEDERRTRTSHLNQLRGYVIDSKFEGQKIGALFYPMVNDDLTQGELYPIKGQNIIVKTINLNDDWQNIEKDMLSFVNKVESNRALA